MLIHDCISRALGEQGQVLLVLMHGLISGLTFQTCLDLKMYLNSSSRELRLFLSSMTRALSSVLKLSYES